MPNTYLVMRPSVSSPSGEARCPQGAEIGFSAILTILPASCPQTQTPWLPATGKNCLLRKPQAMVCFGPEEYS